MVRFATHLIYFASDRSFTELLYLHVNSDVSQAVFLFLGDILSCGFWFLLKAYMDLNRLWNLSLVEKL